MELVTRFARRLNQDVAWADIEELLVLINHVCVHAVLCCAVLCCAVLCCACMLDSYIDPHVS